MKVRNDFVSNSSSCSFVIAINKEYKLKDFVKDLAKECTNPKSEYHNKDLTERNKRILDFCLNTYELAFLGTWKLHVNEEVCTKEDFISWFVDRKEDNDLDENTKEMLLKTAKEYWKHELDNIEKAKKPDCDPYFKKQVERNYLDQDGKLHMFDDIYVENCVVNSDTMRYEFNRYGYDTDNDDRSIKHRIKQLKKIAEEYADYENGKIIGCPHIGCYAITLNTINNTRDLLKAGIKLEFNENINIDDLEKRLKAGEKIFNVHIGHDGEGYGDFEIYCEDNANGLDNVAAEIIDSESM